MQVTLAGHLQILRIQEKAYRSCFAGNFANNLLFQVVPIQEKRKSMDLVKVDLL